MMRITAAVAVVCLIGAAIGAGVSRRSSGSSATTGTVGYNAGGNPDKDADDRWEDWEAQHGYDDGDKYEVVDEDREPVNGGGGSGQAEVEDTTYESTNTISG